MEVGYIAFLTALAQTYAEGRACHMTEVVRSFDIDHLLL
jgi:hypothetical protein